MSEAVNFYKEPGEPLDRAAIDLGPMCPRPMTACSSAVAKR